MITCPECQTKEIQRNGVVARTTMTVWGKRNKKVQTFVCENKHYFRVGEVPKWDDSFIERVVFIYLQCLSLNTTITIMREIYRDDVLTKGLILDFIEHVADALPTLDDIDRLFQPMRSGYLAFDGVWFTLQHKQIVLLVAFDPETFDIVSARFEEDETERGYEELFTQVFHKVKPTEIKGIYADGDSGFIRCRNRFLPHVPFQLCVFHKELRMGQVVPVKSVRRSKQMTSQTKHDIKVFQLLFRDVIYAKSKDDSTQALERLKRYVESTKHQQPERFLTAYRSLNHNFTYTLTHFDHPHMRRDNNLLECFNGCLKPRLRLMKGFKKKENLDRYLKLFLLEFRFHPLKESTFKERNGNSPLEIANASLPKFYNFLTFLREELHLSYQPKIS